MIVGQVKPVTEILIHRAVPSSNGVVQARSRAVAPGDRLIGLDRMAG